MTARTVIQWNSAYENKYKWTNVIKSTVTMELIMKQLHCSYQPVHEDAAGDCGCDNVDGCGTVGGLGVCTLDISLGVGAILYTRSGLEKSTSLTAAI